MPIVLALLAASAVMCKIGNLGGVMRVLWMAAIAVACVAAALAAHAVISRRRIR